MKDHEIARLVNQLREIGEEYGRTQQLRGRIAAVVVPALDGLENEIDRLRKLNDDLADEVKLLRALLAQAYAATDDVLLPLVEELQSNLDVAMDEITNQNAKTEYVGMQLAACQAQNADLTDQLTACELKRAEHYKNSLRCTTALMACQAREELLADVLIEVDESLGRFCADQGSTEEDYRVSDRVSAMLCARSPNQSMRELVRDAKRQERERCIDACTKIASAWRGANSQAMECVNAIRELGDE